MSRQEMPSRRQVTRQKIYIGTQKVYIDIGFRDQEMTQVGEIFIIMEKTGADMRSLVDELARLASKLLQYGCPLEEFALSWLGLKGTPCGPVRGDRHIKQASSLRDYVARYLLINFCDRKDLAHVKEPA